MYENSNAGNPQTLANWIHKEGFDKNLTVKLIHNNNCICLIEGHDTFIIKSFDNSEEVKKSLINAGFVNMFLFFTENSNPESGNHSINLDMDISRWFLDALRKKIIVPDTNILLNRLFSTMDEIVGQNITKQMKIKIPRLSILELEKKANQDKKKHGKKEVCF